MTFEVMFSNVGNKLN